MTLKYTAPVTLCKKFKVNWENENIKYLGIYLTKDLSGPSSIKADLHRWNLIPFLSLSSSEVKMNMLPRLLYLFRNLPTEVSENQFRE